MPFVLAYTKNCLRTFRILSHKQMITKINGRNLTAICLASVSVWKIVFSSCLLFIVLFSVCSLQFYDACSRFYSRSLYETLHHLFFFIRFTRSLAHFLSSFSSCTSFRIRVLCVRCFNLIDDVQCVYMYSVFTIQILEIFYIGGDL